MRGATPGKKAATLQQKNVEAKIKKNKWKTLANGNDGSTGATSASSEAKDLGNEETLMNKVEVKVKMPEELKP
ncbi:Mortality factor 4-like protein 1 [Galemys pyrenaicus]|uniref:Mortality factor 4-like protein 1 n=1 Tax=Galemys pyrenaicus TaxID=202257 RepID=A0A8J6ASM3_GALPY|nr:Mortality factor 4-like protein 1 [Galemys pyrenaicus]